MNILLRHSLRFAIVLAVLCFVCGSSLQAANWYVDSAATAGSRNGQSWTNAWTTMSSIAWTNVIAGDVIWVRGGPYDERVTIGKSGTSVTARITLKGVGSPVIRGISGGSRDYIAVLGFEISHVSTANNYFGITLDGADGWLIEDNYIHDTYRGGIDAGYGSINQRNIIRNNRFHNICSINQGSGSSIAIQVYGHSNLIEYNRITLSLDRIRAFGTGNVIRNNFFGYTDTTLYMNSSPSPFHTDGFQSYNSTLPLAQVLFERNWDEENMDSRGGTNAHAIIIQNDDGSPMEWGIFRFNMIVRPGGVAFDLRGFNRLYGYSSTYIGIQNQARGPYQNAIFYSGTAADIQDWRNNTWSFSPNTMDNAGLFPTASRPTNFTSDYQHRFDAGVLPSAPNNINNVDPQFVDMATNDFRLSSGSPLRNAGGAITTAVSAGTSSTSLTVVDAKRLFDGWGIADGDFIKIGSNTYVQIVSINYSTNVVTLASAKTWSSGAAVYVKGSEDIGALPYSFAKPFTIADTTPALVTGSNTLSATVDFPEAVRMVEFLVDGIPVGIDYTAPFTATYVSDGAPHTVNARAYAMWAARDLTVDTDGAPKNGRIIITQP